MELTTTEVVIGIIMTLFAGIGFIVVSFWLITILENRHKRKKEKDELVDTMEHDIRYLKRRCEYVYTSATEEIEDLDKRLSKLEKLSRDKNNE